jgi:Na+/H+ antiporter NhaD/arsenite permease-like protein
MILYLGLASIIFVPIFKTITHLPPYVGMMFSLALVSTIAEILSSTKINITSFDDESDDAANHSPVHRSLSKIELPSILFFLGILLSVSALESIGVLFSFADTLNLIFPNTDIVVVLLGMASAVIDNVPLVAASMGMFSEQINNPLWHFIAFSAGTGGSMLIIGSAAGVVAMGMEKIDFFWYFKKISWLALIGFLSGTFTFIIIRDFIY